MAHYSLDVLEIGSHARDGVYHKFVSMGQEENVLEFIAMYYLVSLGVIRHKISTFLSMSSSQPYHPTQINRVPIIGMQRR